ncbi:MAG: glycoside hydrolase, partial [Bacteroidales bacterium]|nr:glycoside hydrolase [Bacteroidales bacterium]
AILLGSTNLEDYPEMTTGYRFYGDDWVKQSLIFGSKLENIAISGGGVIDGQGAAFKVTTKLKPDRYRNRPYLIRFTECTGVSVKDVTLQNSAMWMQHYLACDHLLIRDIKVYNHCNKNNDMIDIDGCRDVILTGCVGDTDDDALTLKSTSPRACENITISNCVLSSHCNAIKFGTESTGGFKNITITNCVVKPSSKKEVIYGYPGGISGISLEVVDGGVMDGVIISDVLIDGPEVPLFIRLGNRARSYMEGLEKPPTGVLQNIRIENIVIRNSGKTGCSVTGIEGFPARNISLHQITMHLPGGMTETGDDWEVPELEEHYPESTMFGVLPASVFYMRHLENIDLSGISVSFQEPDARIHLIAEDVVGLRYSRIHVSNSDEIRILEKRR